MTCTSIRCARIHKHVQLTLQIPRLYTLSPPTWLDEEQNFIGMDRRSSVRTCHGACDWSFSGQLKVKIWQAKAIHDCRRDSCIDGTIHPRLDNRDRELLHRRVGIGKGVLHQKTECILTSSIRDASSRLPWLYSAYISLILRSTQVRFNALPRQEVPTYQVTVQSTSRSLIVDTLPIPKQQKGSAWGK